MKLSIYVNLRSIAWIVSNGATVVANGIKRVMTDFDTYYEYIAGLPVSKRTNRRIKRSARRNLSRYKNRRELLIRIVGKPKKHYTLTEILNLRVRALSEKVTPDEFTAILFSLQSRRGYKSMRGVLGEGDYLAEIQQHEENLKNYRSVADYLITFPSIKNVILTRQSYEAEFFTICKAQAIGEDMQRKLYSAIYFQFPLKKGKVAHCKLEKNRTVCHSSHPHYQRFRILRDVNNITITDRNLDEVDITSEIRSIWIAKLMSGKNLTKASCLKDLGVKKSAGYSWMSGKQIDGNPIPNISVELWQELFSATDEDKLRELLCKKYPSQNPNELIDIDITGMGWGEYSHKAIARLIPYLEHGKTLKEAIIDEYGVVDLTADPTLRNLVLEQHFESYKSLVSKIKKEFDITESVIEINHLLKAGNKSRKEMARAKRADVTYKQKHADLSDYKQHLLKLHDEFNGISPYEPSHKITLAELFCDYNVDHIVPKSKLFEHGMVNQCLCRKDLNEQKGSLTGVEFARQLGIEDDYRNCIDNLKVSERKKRFLLMESNDIPDNYLTIADYNTRCFASVIGATVIPNRIINKYQRDWDFDTCPDNDVNQSMEKCTVLSNFDQSTVDYFNTLKKLPNTSIGRYNLTPIITPNNLKEYYIYIPRLKFYRNSKSNPRFALHDESIMGKRKELSRNSRGEIVTNYYFKIRKPVASLTPAMVEKVIDGAIRRKLLARMGERKWEDVLPELLENPITHNGKPVKSVSIRINASNLIELPRGYAYSSMNHHFNISDGKPVRLFDYLNGEYNFGKSIKKQDIIRYNGNLYFVSGLADYISLRRTSELNAVDEFKRLSKAHIKNVEIVRVDELSRLTKIEKLG